MIALVPGAVAAAAEQPVMLLITSRAAVKVHAHSFPPRSSAVNHPEKSYSCIRSRRTFELDPAAATSPLGLLHVDAWPGRTAAVHAHWLRDWQTVALIVHAASCVGRHPSGCPTRTCVDRDRRPNGWGTAVDLRRMPAWVDGGCYCFLPEKTLDEDVLKQRGLDPCCCAPRMGVNRCI